MRAPHVTLDNVDYVHGSAGSSTGEGNGLVGGRRICAELAIAHGETVPVPVIDGVLLGRMEIGTWQTRVGRFDILRGIPKTATSRAEFEELSARAITSDVSGRAVRVADLEDAVRSKRIAGRPEDHEALPELDELRAAAAGGPPPDPELSPPLRHVPPQPSPPTQRAYRPPSTQQRPRDPGGLGR
ncbi:MAG: hypothetical protein ACLP50_09790 [Solirubrobacteraceae bacterium]